MRVLVTGAGGFIGRALVARLSADGRYAVRAATRQPTVLPTRIDIVAPRLIDGYPDWSHGLAETDIIVHLAGRAHVLRDGSTDPLAEFRRINAAGSRRLASQAAAAGVRRFVFVSTAKVHGEHGLCRETDSLSPADPYALSKCEAEAAVCAVRQQTGLEIVIVRPPLVYGPDARANFAALMSAVQRGVPLPFASVRNRRSLVALDNLVDFLSTCIAHPAAANEPFLVSDDQDLSTPEIVSQLACALDRPARLLPVPPALIAGGAVLLGRRAQISRLLTSFQVDISKARSTLGWRPPISVAEGFKRAVARSH